MEPIRITFIFAGVSARLRSNDLTCIPYTGTSILSGLVLTLFGINIIDPVLRDIAADFSLKLFRWYHAQNMKIILKTSQRNNFDTVTVVMVFTRIIQYAQCVVSRLQMVVLLPYV